MTDKKELICGEENGSLSFGDHTLAEKAKAEDFAYAGDLYKVKTYQAMTKLEKNGMFAYESVPGTTVTGFLESENGVSFTAEGCGEAQLTVGLQDDTEYTVCINGSETGSMKTNLGGKLSLSVDLTERVCVEIRR